MHGVFTRRRNALATVFAAPRRACRERFRQRVLRPCGTRRGLPPWTLDAARGRAAGEIK
jgi:hypothetical protein